MMGWKREIQTERAIVGKDDAEDNEGAIGKLSMRLYTEFGADTHAA